MIMKNWYLKCMLHERKKWSFLSLQVLTKIIKISNRNRYVKKKIIQKSSAVGKFNPLLPEAFFPYNIEAIIVYRLIDAELIGIFSMIPSFFNKFSQKGSYFNAQAQMSKYDFKKCN